MQKNIGIYKITNIVNGKFYIGSSKNINNRKNRHASSLRCGKHHSTHLQRAFDKYGHEKFKFEVVERCKEGELIEREQYYLDLLKPYDYKVGYNESILANSPSRGKGERCWNYGKTGNRNAKSVKVVQFDMDNKYIKTFDSAHLAEKETGTDSSTIIKVCKRKKCSSNGYKWSYVEDFKNGSYKENTHKFKKKAVKLSMENLYQETYESMREAGTQNSINYKNIHSCCSGKRKTAGGFKWMYYDDYVKLNKNQNIS